MRIQHKLRGLELYYYEGWLTLVMPVNNVRLHAAESIDEDAPGKVWWGTFGRLLNRINEELAEHRRRKP